MTGEWYTMFVQAAPNTQPLIAKASWTLDKITLSVMNSGTPLTMGLLMKHLRKIACVSLDDMGLNSDQCLLATSTYPKMIYNDVHKSYVTKLHEGDLVDEPIHAIKIVPLCNQYYEAFTLLVAVSWTYPDSFKEDTTLFITLDHAASMCPPTMMGAAWHTFFSSFKTPIHITTMPFKCVTVDMRVKELFKTNVMRASSWDQFMVPSEFKEMDEMNGLKLMWTKYCQHFSSLLPPTISRIKQRAAVVIDEPKPVAPAAPAMVSWSSLPSSEIKEALEVGVNPGQDAADRAAVKAKQEQEDAKDEDDITEDESVPSSVPSPAPKSKKNYSAKRAIALKLQTVKQQSHRIAELEEALKEALEAKGNVKLKYKKRLAKLQAKVLALETV